MANRSLQARRWPWIDRFAKANAALIAAANLGEVNASGNLAKAKDRQCGGTSVPPRYVTKPARSRSASPPGRH